MHKTAVILACSIHIGGGQRFESLAEQLQKSPNAKRIDHTAGLAAALLAISPLPSRSREALASSAAHHSADASRAMQSRSVVMTSSSQEMESDRHRRAVLKNGIGAALMGFGLNRSPALAEDASDKPTMKKLNPIQFIAALGDPGASSGVGAEKWGLWREDPGPRGVFLRQYEQALAKYDNVAAYGWKFDPSSWWVEEHGLIMETPAKLPLAKKGSQEKRYYVTGGRETKSILTVHSDGRWELSQGTLYDVTHLPCRAAVYTGADGGVCTPRKENQKLFPVQPGAKMPKFEGCNTQDWAVLFVLGEEV